jgi:hypothetical protein
LNGISTDILAVADVDHVGCIPVFEASLPFRLNSLEPEAIESVYHFKQNTNRYEPAHENGSSAQVLLQVVNDYLCEHHYLRFLSDSYKEMTTSFDKAF